MRFLGDFMWNCKILVVPLMFLALVAIVLDLKGYKDTAWMVGSVGPLAVLLLNVVYIVVVDSRKRWPSDGWFSRLANVLTFRR